MRLLLIATLFLQGCVYIKEAQVDNLNTAGWKSQAGVTGDATIEATTIPTTDVTGL